MIKGFDVSDTIQAVNNWAMADGNEDFDTTFVESLSEGLEKFGHLTERQVSALENIIDQFNIDISTYA